MNCKNIVVGAGFAGATIARIIAEKKGEEVFIIEKRNHIAGNAYDCYNEYGVLIHKYGPHIFHTNNKAVWDWLSNFTDWRYYQHRVLAFVDGMKLPMPISVETINKLYNLKLNCNEIENWLKNKAINIDEIRNSEDVILSKAGKEIYEKFFKNYTYKQWGKYPNELDPLVISRIPVRNTRDTRYFTDKYQGIPKYGYTRMFENILAHKNIHLLLNTDWLDVKNRINYDTLYYTGPIDEYYDYKFGKLEYRSVRFEYETLHNKEYAQEVGTINYPNDYDFTRITEYKHLTGQQCINTTIVKEYPSANGEPYYIMPNIHNMNIAARYRELAENEKIIYFHGRLAEYKYYNMDVIIANAFSLFENIGKNVFHF
jgi:UDP-galactopyranose mutase